MYAFLSGGVAGLVEQRFWLRWALHSLSFAAVLMGLSCEAASPCSSNQLLSPILGVPCWAGADINRDGQSDVLLYSSANTAYYAGIADSNHDGNFGNGLGYPSALWSGGFSTIKMADFNGDGIMDVLLYKSDGSQTVVAIGRGNGYFDYYAVFFSPGYTVEAGDLDGDGKADLILYNAATGTTYLATNWSSASNNFTTYTYNLWSPGFTRICAADFNGDGVSDVLMYRLSDGQAYVGINNTPQGSAFSAFTFYWEAFNAGYDFLQAGDLNADGKTDLIVYNSSTGLSYTLFWNGSGNYFNGVSLPNLSTGYTQVQGS